LKFDVFLCNDVLKRRFKLLRFYSYFQLITVRNKEVRMTYCVNQQLYWWISENISTSDSRTCLIAMFLSGVKWWTSNTI